MKGIKVKKGAPALAKKDPKELSKKAEETNLKKKQLASKEEKGKTRKAQKAKKDPNKPKRPPSAFFVFLEEFRKSYKLDHPGVKAVSAVGKAGGDKWKSLSDAEKSPYVAKAAKRKAEYEKSIQAYNQKKGQPAEADESDKSKSEINDDDEDEDEEIGEEEEEED